LPSVRLAVRYFVFLLGLFFMGLGVSLITKSNLGTAPISSVPYVLSLMLPLTMGEFTFLLSLIFLLVQIVILRKGFPKKQYMQVLVGPFFGLFIDLGMFLFAMVNPQVYLSKILLLLLGSVVVAVGIYLEVAANVILNPGEGMVKTIAQISGIRFGYIKIFLDCTLVTSTAIISLLVFGAIKGLREGTLVSAVLTGWIVNGLSFVLMHFRLTRDWMEYLSGSVELLSEPALSGAE
jgi:uncharacterized protein